MKIKNIEYLSSTLKDTDSINVNTINKSFHYFDEIKLGVSSSIFGIFNYKLSKLEDGIGQLESYFEELTQIERDYSNQEDVDATPSFEMGDWESQSYMNNNSEFLIFRVRDEFYDKYIGYIDEIIDFIEDSFENKEMSRDNEEINSFLEELNELREEALKNNKNINTMTFSFEHEEKDIDKLNKNIMDTNQEILDVESEINVIEYDSESESKGEIYYLEKKLNERKDDKESLCEDAASLTTSLQNTVKESLDIFETVVNNISTSIDDIQASIDSFIDRIKEGVIFTSELESSTYAEKFNIDDYNEKLILTHVSIPGNNKHSGEWIVFLDTSIAYKDQTSNYEWKVLNHNIKEFNKKIIKITESVISYKSRKTPAISEFLGNKIVKEKKLDIGLSVLSEFTLNKKMLVKNNFLLENYKSYNLEGIYDNIQSILLKEKAITTMKRLVDGKYRFLINDESEDISEKMIKIGQKMIQDGIDKKFFNDNIGKKLDYYLNMDGSVEEKRQSFEDDTISAIKSLKGWHVNSYLAKIKTNNKGGIKIISNTEDELIIAVDSHLECKSVGSQAWCISKDVSFWNQYGARGDFYIKYDFTKDSEDRSSMIGFHLNASEIINAHYKDDSMVKNEERSEILQKIKAIGLRTFGTKTIIIPNDEYEDYVISFMENNPNYTGGGSLLIENSTKIKTIHGDWNKVEIINSEVENIYTEGRILKIKNNRTNVKIAGVITTLDCVDMKGVLIKESSVDNVNINRADSLIFEDNKKIVSISVEDVKGDITLDMSAYKNITKKNAKIVNISNVIAETVKLDKLNQDLTITNYNHVILNELNNFEVLNFDPIKEFYLTIKKISEKTVLSSFVAPLGKIRIEDASNLESIDNNELLSLDISTVPDLSVLVKNKIDTIDIKFNKNENQEIQIKRNRIKKILTNKPQIFKRTPSSRKNNP